MAETSEHRLAGSRGAVVSDEHLRSELTSTTRCSKLFRLASIRKG